MAPFIGSGNNQQERSTAGGLEAALAESYAVGNAAVTAAFRQSAEQHNLMQLLQYLVPLECLMWQHPRYSKFWRACKTCGACVGCRTCRPAGSPGS